MIYSIFHKGSGVGDQLFRYLTVRTIAEDLGYEWGMIGWENFKARFIDLDLGKCADIPFHIEEPAGKVIPETNIPMWNEETAYYNPEINFLSDNTIIDGNFQDERYWGHKPIGEWLKTEPLDMPDDLCVINFRGGEFSYVPELFLPQEYWDKGIEEMMKINRDMRFEVHTDDTTLAKAFFPDFHCVHDVGLNWRSIWYSKYKIIPNSAFPIIPSLFGLSEKVIAPRYWARRNIKQWHLPENYYKKFTYL